MKIGLFDSGKGGMTIFEAVKKRLPGEEYLYIADSENCPYGEKTDGELYEIVRKNVEKLLVWGARIIVIACNTATVKCIERLRNDYKNVVFVGTEPAVKMALKTGARKVLILATPNTIESERMQELIGEAEVDLVACPGLAETIERYGNDIKVVRRKLSELLTVDSSYDAVVLGCTHYALIKNEIQKYYPSAKLIDGADGVARRVEAAVRELAE